MILYRVRGYNKIRTCDFPKILSAKLKQERRNRSVEHGLHQIPLSFIWSCYTVFNHRHDSLDFGDVIAWKTFEQEYKHDTFFMSNCVKREAVKKNL